MTTGNYTANPGIREGLGRGLTLCIGFFPVAIAFGILARSTGLSLFETAAFSVFVFAGSSQFIAMNMLALGASGFEIVLTTLFVNFRHFLMSASLAPKTDFSNTLLKAVTGFFVTDESFSVASFTEGRLSDRYLLPMQLFSYLGWTTGTVAGFLLGSILPPLLQQSMGIGIYAIFAALLVPEIKKSRRTLFFALTAGCLNSFLILHAGMQQGWSIIVTIITVSAAGAFVFGRETVPNNDLMGEPEYEQ